MVVSKVGAQGGKKVIQSLLRNECLPSVTLPMGRVVTY